MDERPIIMQQPAPEDDPDGSRLRHTHVILLFAAASGWRWLRVRERLTADLARPAGKRR